MNSNDKCYATCEWSDKDNLEVGLNLSLRRREVEAGREEHESNSQDFGGVKSLRIDKHNVYANLVWVWNCG